jgi:hypothetical protein
MATASIRNRFRSNGEETVVDHVFFGKKVGFFVKIFGCGHQDLSRPFSRGRIGYRTCLRCGARKPFNPDTLETFGNFYYPPISKAESD